MIQCGGSHLLQGGRQARAKASGAVAEFARNGLSFWSFPGLILALFSMLSLSSVASAQTLDVFTVANIPVDVTAKTAAAARQQALADGEKRAFELLLKRLTMRIDHQRLPVLEAKEISGYVQDFGVANEKNSLVRYLANLTYRFKPRDIRFLLRDSDIQFAETRSKPILVLPVYQVAGAVSLWDDPNPWRQAWADRLKDAKAAKIDGLVPMIFASGDLADIATIGAELAVKGDEQRLAAIAQRYRVATTMVVLGTLRSTSRGRPVLSVSIFRYGKNENRQAFSTEIEAKQGEDIDTLLIRAAVEINARIEDQWKANNLLKFERAGVVAVTLPIRNLPDWVDAKRRLARVAVIENAELVLLSRTEVRLNIHFIGEAEQLKLALAQADMVLTEEEGSWIVKLQPRIKSGVKSRVKSGKDRRGINRSGGSSGGK
tara:strand:- start:2944 stop:4236 length:1293 start_codon:yes stop_codon:yes gene_type:complete